VAAGLPEEQLESVGRRLDHLRRLEHRLGDTLLLFFDDLDAALLELLAKRFVLEQVELERLEDFLKLLVTEGATVLLGCFEQVAHVLAAEDGLDLSRRHAY
jgi:hypothetical protein